MILTDPKTLGIAFLVGIIPSLIWLSFWLREDEGRPEPKGLVATVFGVGMLAVILVLPIEQFIKAHVPSPNVDLFLWAAAEELLKFLAVILVLSNAKEADEPVDWPTYMITAALGFAALENAFFLVKPIALQGTIVGLFTGDLRFLGSTLLHTVASGIWGIFIGFAFFLNNSRKFWYGLLGFLFAVALHTAFNFFIIRNSGKDFMAVSAFLWVAAVIVMLLFEKIRRMSGEI